MRVENRSALLKNSLRNSDFFNVLPFGVIFLGIFFEFLVSCPRLSEFSGYAEVLRWPTKNLWL
jgi:hypothetical protein